MPVRGIADGYADRSAIAACALFTGHTIVEIEPAVIPGEPLEIAGGYAFGAVWGTIVCLVAATLGSLLVFWR